MGSLAYISYHKVAWRILKSRWDPHLWNSIDRTEMESSQHCCTKVQCEDVSSVDLSLHTCASPVYLGSTFLEVFLGERCHLPIKYPQNHKLV